jgi:hypothetical protein
MKIKKGDAVLVTWTDAQSHNNWQDTKGPFPPAAARSLGFVIEDTPKYLSVAQSLADDGTLGDVLSIPRGMIQKIVKK